MLGTLAHSGAARTLDQVADRAVPLLPETTSVGAMLRELQERPAPVVFVIDEYGGITGMITIENLVGKLPASSPSIQPTSAPCSPNTAASSKPTAAWMLA